MPFLKKPFKSNNNISANLKYNVDKNLPQNVLYNLGCNNCTKMNIGRAKRSGITRIKAHEYNLYLNN